MALEVGETGLTPEQSFAALGHETRIDILQALWEADHPLAYSDLMRHVGIQDSGQFNYHLDQLVGMFVSREGDHYRLRETGNWLIRGLLAGTITENPSFESVALELPCPRCDADTVEASYEDDVLTVRCRAHGGRVLVGAPNPEKLEGEWDHNFSVVLEFPSVEDAQQWYDDTAYEAVKPTRHEACEYTNMVIAPEFSPADLEG